MDAAGEKRYQLEGKWDSYLNLIDLRTHQKEEIWRIEPLPKEAD